MNKFLIEIDGFKTCINDDKNEAIDFITKLFDNFIESIKDGPTEGYHVDFPSFRFINLSETDWKRFLMPTCEFSNVLIFPNKGTNNEGTEKNINK